MGVQISFNTEYLNIRDWLFNTKLNLARFKVRSQIKYFPAACLEVWQYSSRNLAWFIVERISAQFLHNRAFCEESTTLTECIDVYTSMNIRYGAICQINAESQNYNF